MGMKILVTGGAGFIGSNFVRFMLSKHSDMEIVNVDLLTYAGNLENLAGLEDEPRYTLERGNIADPDRMNSLFEEHDFDAVVNFAAESHVDRSIHMGAHDFIMTNIYGVQVLLDASREHGVERFLQVSTDEVYGSLGAEGLFTEDSPIQPNNPYAATKAGADFMVRAACETHGLDAVITRCANNFGLYQFPEKLIPLMITNAIEDKELPMYGDGLYIRDWIYVPDHCSAIDLVLRKATAGSIYNIGGEHDLTNLDIVSLILKLVDKPESLIKHVKDRPGHDRRYAMDSSKIRADLGWEPDYSFKDAMDATVSWYLDNSDWWKRIRSGEYQEYYSRMYEK